MNLEKNMRNIFGHAFFAAAVIFQHPSQSHLQLINLFIYLMLDITVDNISVMHICNRT